MEASIPASLLGELLRLNVEVFVDVAERTLDLIHERDAAADQPDAHAGLQQHEAGTDARDERVAGIGQYERVGNERIAELHRECARAVERHELRVVGERDAGPARTARSP